MTRFSVLRAGVVSLACLMTLVGCGGGSSSSDPTTTPPPAPPTAVPGLTLPSNLSIVSANDDPAASVAQSTTSGGTARPLTDPGTDYSTDVANVYVYDRAMESLGTVNMILCLMDQTGAPTMVNQGSYIALVDEDKCEQGENQSDSGATGQASGGGATEYESWTITSTRATDTDPQIVQIWVPGDQPDPNDPEGAFDSQTILVEVTVDEGVSDSVPFGSFSMNFSGVLDSGMFGGTPGVEMEMMRGMLRTVDNGLAQPQFEFVNLGGSQLAGASFDFGFQEAANVIMDDAGGTGGTAVTYSLDQYTPPGQATMEEESKFAIAFNVTHLLRGVDNDGDDTVDAEQCLSRDNFSTQVWRYNLYHFDDGTFNGASVTAGQRVDVNSGFPFTYDTDGDGTNDAYGWVGYHGVWSESGDIADNTTIFEFDYVNDTTIQHTVKVSPGKLVRRAANQELLTSFQGDEFEFWGQHPTLGIVGQWIVTVTTTNDFRLIERFEWTEAGPVRSPTIDHDGDPATAEVDVGADLTFQDGENVWLWAEALGGNVVYVHDSAVAAVDRDVTFYSHEFVNPDDASLFASASSITLYCYDRCLIGGLTQSDVDAALSDWDLYYTYVDAPFEYTLTSADGRLTLTDNTSAMVVDASALDLSTIGNEWGIGTGDMLTTPLADATQPWLVYDEPVTLNWETGPNAWNRHVSVVDSTGTIASFDKPLRFLYTHTTANDANGDATFDGKKFMLEYNGPGNLHGFPWVEDIDTRRWHSAVTLADGVQLTDGTNLFAVKGIEMEQTMQDVAVGDCAPLDVSTIFANPTLALPTVIDIGTVSFTRADMPDVTDAPAVIDGVVQ